MSIEELSPRMFSFNSPFGACPECGGLGTVMRISPETVIPNPDLSLNQGALQAMGWNTMDKNSMAMSYFRALADLYGFSLDTPVRDLPPKILAFCSTVPTTKSPSNTRVPMERGSIRPPLRA